MLLSEHAGSNRQVENDLFKSDSISQDEIGFFHLDERIYRDIMGDLDD